MSGGETEAALVVLLSRLSDTDDSDIADRAIERYLDRLDERDRPAALNRLTHALLAAPETPARESRPGPLPSPRRSSQQFPSEDAGSGVGSLRPPGLRVTPVADVSRPRRDAEPS